MMRIYLSYNSMPELKGVPVQERRKVVKRAATTLAGTASGPRQFRVAVAWLVLVAASAMCMGSYSSLTPW